MSAVTISFVSKTKVFEEMFGLLPKRQCMRIEKLLLFRATYRKFALLLTGIFCLFGSTAICKLEILHLFHTVLFCRENPLTLAGEKGHVELVSLLLSR